ncbi:MAG TPA: heme-binding domain-containing protein [Draconibacterium sp.]|nr:heme-binding domain-containing protein [Draconibacterium sp.]
MRLFIKIFVVAVIVAFVVIQFFQPEKNLSTDTKNLIFLHEQIPEDVQQILKNACMDCHSNNTKYLWYHKISPVSWMVNKHIIEGKKELNFSEWGEMDDYDKIGAVEDIRQELEQKTMPIKQYVAMHKEAKLSDEDRTAIFAWLDKKGNELVKSSNE